MVDVLIPLETVINLTLAKVPPIETRKISVQKVLPVYQKLAHSSAKWAELIMAIQIIKFQAVDTKFARLLPKNEGRKFVPF